ncbi:hypothetical protein H2200_007878 [Cladophialophora chaetospira]|uniref:Uncharacterized protein n=1 Tax=Cladophialophora chaetospira TaxID=386627 RepID=A0AA39CGU5_9EURO|nr:hypothetical protein H2200_007878 [Cladophialophora chaetospira]
MATTLIINLPAGKLREEVEINLEAVETYVADQGIPNEFTESRMHALAMRESEFERKRPASVPGERRPSPHAEQVEVAQTRIEERRTQSDNTYEKPDW